MSLPFDDYFTEEPDAAPAPPPTHRDAKRPLANRLAQLRFKVRRRRAPKRRRRTRANEPKPRLMFVITNAHLGGAQSNVYDLISSFRDRYDIHMVVGVEGLLSQQIRELDVPVSVIPSLERDIAPIRDIRCALALRRIIRKVRPNLIHAHSTKAGLVARLVGRLEGVPVVYTAHGWVFSPGFPRRTRALVWAMEFVSSRISTHVVCVSEYDRHLARRYLRLPDKRLSVVPCGIRRTTATSRIPGPRASLIMVARFQDPKDHATAIRAVSRLRPDSFDLTFVGSGPLMSEAMYLAEEYGVSEQISFVGESSRVSEFLAEADIFLLFSHHEGLPISILEAMRASLPVVASRVGGVSEEVQDGVSGILVPSGDVTRSAKAIRRLVEDVETRQQMGDAGRQIFEQRFTRGVMIEQFASIYAKNRLA